MSFNAPAAERLGVAPCLVYGEDGVLVSRYIPSRTLDPAVRETGDCVQTGADAAAIARRVGRIDRGTPFFCPFQASRTYAATSRRLGAHLPANIEQMLETTRRLSHTIAPYMPTLCHNDMLPANILDDGGRIWIVDWEYAGIGNPLFDLAGVSANCGYSPEQDVAFLESYHGKFRHQDLYQLRVFKVASLLRDALWGVVQTVVSDLEFDYREYARHHFEKYQDALATLSNGPTSGY